MTRIRAVLLAALGLALPLATLPLLAQETSQSFQLAQLQGGTIGAIRITGNQRIEESTIRSYMLVRPGDRFDPEQLDKMLAD